MPLRLCLPVVYGNVYLTEAAYLESSASVDNPDSRRFLSEPLANLRLVHFSPPWARHRSTGGLLALCAVEERWGCIAGGLLQDGQGIGTTPAPCDWHPRRRHVPRPVDANLFLRVRRPGVVTPRIVTEVTSHSYHFTRKRAISLSARFSIGKPPSELSLYNSSESSILPSGQTDASPHAKLGDDAAVQAPGGRDGSLYPGQHP